MSELVNVTPHYVGVDSITGDDVMVCNVKQARSFHPKDISEQYCPFCHVYWAHV